MKNREFTNLCKKVSGKKVSGKKPGNKNFGKKVWIFSVLGKNVTGNKVLCFGFLGLFFPKIVWGLPIKSQEIRSQEKKSWRKEILGKEKPRKKVLSLGKFELSNLSLREKKS